ncbi:MAG: DnaJ domain-containing protein [Thermoguttaceae bacterium]
MKNYYAILGLPKTATPAEIDAAFRSLAKKYHPDAQPEEEDATVQFKLATEAHEVLSNVEKRWEFDRTQHRRRRVPVSESPFPTRSVQSKPNAKPPPGSLDIEAELRLVPEEANRGRSIEMRIATPAPCPACGGQVGAACLMCGGEGTVIEPRLVHLQLPPGLGDGTVIRIPGYGRAAFPDGPMGDLYLLVRVRPCW